MTLSHLQLTDPLLSHDEELQLVRAVEAGTYAQHLLSSRDPSGALLAVAAAGRAAWGRLWRSNLRLVVKLARESARRHGLPLDDLFQEGCLGLADALMRYDFARGTRLSTVAFEYVQRRIAAAAASRCGMFEGPNHRHRVRQRLRLLESELQSTQRPVTQRDVAAHAGLSLLRVAAVDPRHTALDDVPQSRTAVEGGYERVESHGVDFLDLMGLEGRVLRLRFGIGVRPHTQEKAAEALGMSATSIRRLETRALRHARELLTADVCRAVPAA